MMQVNEIQQRFDHIEQTIHQAALACESAPTLPMEVKDCIQQLEQKTGQVRQVMQGPDDEPGIWQCIDDLEQLGDRAKEACQQSDNVDDEIKTVVMQAHKELSELKQQIH